MQDILEDSGFSEDENVTNARKESVRPKRKDEAYGDVDPGYDSGFSEEDDNDIHIRVHQRSGRKVLTTVQGLCGDFDLKRILKQFRKEFGCNGTIVEDEKLGNVIQLQGDHRQKIRQFLISEGIVKKENVKIHGS